MSDITEELKQKIDDMLLELDHVKAKLEADELELSAFRNKVEARFNGVIDHVKRIESNIVLSFTDFRAHLEQVETKAKGFFSKLFGKK